MTDDTERRTDRERELRTLRRQFPQWTISCDTTGWYALHTAAVPVVAKTATELRMRLRDT